MKATIDFISSFQVIHVAMDTVRKWCSIEKEIIKRVSDERLKVEEKGESEDIDNFYKIP